ncbi:uncharacterized protein FOMMEDRAFT_165121 [Fomitiporia mediterranea MF3/22]|uniref:uncharacterized protein n=1 Tax=Fomitiporia mediterranea (strain MF3/22) TaxID=694068 RepID=UPI0004407AC7|nr:uncharacterized protein FOMMEDRAFT_165121 [Fomitiporia mediterranea MF3/22]EJD08571.1 hypothetical protein FOMMEDRAFT_165121 [Fomitiporia mediterranea MF3/22]
MADSVTAPPASAQSTPSRSSRHDMEGLGKFKLSNAAPRGNSYKSKFFVLKETYDTVTAKREELRRELEVANTRLKAVQAENDLLLDAMQIVAPSQPTLVNILHQMEDVPVSIPAPHPSSSGGTEQMYPDHYGPSGYVPPPDHPGQHEGQIIDAAPLNGTAVSDGYSHAATVNGRTRTREFRERDDHPADEEMLDDDIPIAERDHDHSLSHERERDYAAGAAAGTNGR